MYYNGGNSCCSNINYPTYAYPVQYRNNGTSSYAIVLVLFILLVIVLGSRWAI